MSTEHLTPDERIRYLIGVAVMRQFNQPADDPYAVQDMLAVHRWIGRWLSEDAAAEVTEAVGGSLRRSKAPAGRQCLPQRFPETMCRSDGNRAGQGACAIDPASQIRP